MVIPTRSGPSRLGSTLGCAVIAIVAAVSRSVPATPGDPALDPAFFCPAELIPHEFCADQCPPGLVRAVDLDGVRHVVWSSGWNSAEFYVGASTREGEWTVGSLPIPEATSLVFIAAMAIEGDLLALGRTSRVHLYRLVDHVWLHEATLASTVPGYGRSIALSRDGDGVERLAVGAALSSTVHEGEPGKVFVYRHARNPDGKNGERSPWIAEQAIDPPPTVLHPYRFGSAVALGTSTLVVSAPRNAQMNPSGLSGLSSYSLDGVVWKLDGEIVVPDWLSAISGQRLAMRGETLAMTNGQAEGLSPDTTRVVTLVRSGDAWSFAALLQAEGADVVFGQDLVFADSPTGLLLAAAVDRYSSFPVLTSAWLYRLGDGIPIQSIRLRHPWSISSGNVRARSVALIGGTEPMAVVFGRIPPILSLRVVRTIDDDCDGDGVGDSCAVSDDPSLDCDGSSILDFCEIAGGVLADDNGDGIPDICQPTPDLNGDGIIDGADLGMLLANWGGAGVGDLNQSGKVNGVDLGLLLAAWSE